MKKDVYEPGEWVLTGTYQNRAFVVSSDEWETEIVVTSHGTGTQIPVRFEKDKIKSVTVRTSNLRLAPELPKLYSYDEINLALMTKDKAWYEDITSLRDRQEDEA